ncbi:MAG: GlsB/YeaQ/YmgE family stress response membrane protein [Planctomycetota bacterium]|nr:GlsB/YeaQ/YmgE family stress response membrane protein [Planctomycetota bacterium]
MELLWYLVIGGIAGWAAGLAVKGGGFGMLGNVVVGVVGGVVGGWVFGLLGIGDDGSNVGNFVTAFAGAALLLLVLTQLKK